jgi:hypothetical protein
MSDVFPKKVVKDLISEDRDSIEVNGYEVRGVHSTPNDFHLAIYDEDDCLTGTLDGNRYTSVEEIWQACRVQVGLDRHEQSLGDLFG